jgi:hypothetical protein
LPKQVGLLPRHRRQHPSPVGGETHQVRASVHGVLSDLHETLRAQTADQYLHVLPRDGTTPGELRNGLRTLAIEVTQHAAKAGRCRSQAVYLGGDGAQAMEEGHDFLEHCVEGGDVRRPVSAMGCCRVVAPSLHALGFLLSHGMLLVATRAGGNRKDIVELTSNLSSAAGAFARDLSTRRFPGRRQACHWTPTSPTGGLPLPVRGRGICYNRA